MKTKTLMKSSGVVLGLVGFIALFIPEEMLGINQQIKDSNILVLLQLMGAIFFSQAYVNWMAKDSSAVNLKLVGMGNFAHFLVGFLILAREALQNSQNGLILIGMSLYAFFAYFFWFLVFRSPSGGNDISPGQNPE